MSAQRAEWTGSFRVAIIRRPAGSVDGIHYFSPATHAVAGAIDRHATVVAAPRSIGVVSARRPLLEAIVEIDSEL